MEWEPISESAIWDKINTACLRMDPVQERIWEVVKVIPEKWQQHPHGDVGGGFWAVAIIGCRVLWFNDIEDGFNLSVYSRFGQIDEYWCNQDELEWAVQRVANILESGADGWGRASPPIPGEFNV
jgi:hypothetical protein